MSQTHRRPSGTEPYWPAGTQVMWREGSGPLGTGDPAVDISSPHFAQPVTVVRDDAEALVVRLPVGTPVLRAARADALDKRDDLGTLFTAEVVLERGVHTDFDQLRIAPTGRPWSVWVFFADGTGEFAGWYVNLERPHIRDDGTVYASDHVLDVVIAPDRTVTLKDQDELILAVSQGVFDVATAAAIEADAAEVAELGPLSGDRVVGESVSAVLTSPPESVLVVGDDRRVLDTVHCQQHRAHQPCSISSSRTVDQDRPFCSRQGGVDVSKLVGIPTQVGSP